MRKRSGVFLAMMVVGMIWQPSAVFAEPQGLAKTVRLDNQQARAAAWQALLAGRPAITLKIAKTLWQKDRDDFELIFLQAQALFALGHHTAAAAAARDAYNHAAGKGAQFDAAHLVAKAHFANGAETRAQFWLRRASQHAPNAQAKRLSQRDFQFIRANKPLATRAFFSLFPSSNINNGSVNDEIMVNGLPFQVPVSGQPHSGTGLTAGFETTYTKQVNKRTRLRFGVYAIGTIYKLSNAAKALGSGKTGADFAYANIEARFGLTHLRSGGKTPGWGRFDFNAALGHSWYGGDPLSVHYRADAAQQYVFSDQFTGDMGIGFGIRNRLDSAKNSSKSANILFGLTRKLSGGNKIRGAITAQKSTSDSAFSHYTELGAELSYSLPEMAWDIQPTLSVGLSHTDYSKQVIGATQRKDTKIDASLSLFFPKVSYYGFAPNVTFSGRKNKSNVDIYATRDLRVSFGISSTF